MKLNISTDIDACQGRARELIPEGRASARGCCSAMAERERLPEATACTPAWPLPSDGRARRPVPGRVLAVDQAAGPALIQPPERPSRRPGGVDGVAADGPSSRHSHNYRDCFLHTPRSGRRGSNPYGVNRGILSPLRLPISPRPPGCVGSRGFRSYQGAWRLTCIFADAGLRPSRRR